MVQLYNLPVKKLTVKIVESIGATLGTLVPVQDKSKMFGGNFMQVKVQIDPSQPLCRGCEDDFRHQKKSWVSFKYEKLPNFCYCCGLRFYDAKDSECWVRSKGTLNLDSQEFGEWL